MHAHALVIQEVGYLACGDDTENVLFHVVNEHHVERCSMVFTTNELLPERGTLSLGGGQALVSRGHAHQPTALATVVKAGRRCAAYSCPAQWRWRARR